MISDYTMRRKASNENQNEIFSNLSQFQGKLTIDMRGFSITADENYVKDSNNTSYPSIFTMEIKRWADSGYKDTEKTVKDEEFFPSNFVIKNGSFYTYAAYVLQPRNQTEAIPTIPALSTQRNPLLLTT